jgi:hypothetical protein
MNDHQPSTLLAKCGADRIRLIAIETMKGAFGNEGALRFWTAVGSARVSRAGCGVLAATGFPLVVSKGIVCEPGTASPARATRALPRTTALRRCRLQATDGVSLDFLRRRGSTFSTNVSAVMPCFLRKIGTAPCSMN